MAKIKAKGCTLKYGDTASPSTTIPNRTDVSLDLGQWDRTDITDLDVSDSTKVYDTTLKEPPTMEVNGFFDPADTAHAWLITAHAAGTAKYFILTFPDAGLATISFTAHVTALSFGGITPSGHITFAATLAGASAGTFAQ